MTKRKSFSLRSEMGARESRCLPWALVDKRKETEGQSEECGEDGEETAALPPLEEMDPSGVSRELLELAEKMSEEVVAQALLLCWEDEIHYQELPFIDIQCEYVI